MTIYGKVSKKLDKGGFLSFMSSNPMSTAEIMRCVDCCRNTAKMYLAQLERAGKIRKIVILEVKIMSG
jgi:predicted transcriptional regulator